MRRAPVSPTSTSNNGSDPGFTPNFAAEGRAEGQEFADGMYGLMSSALDYQLDTTPPVDARSLPSGSIGQTSFSLVFNESEPSDIYYTTDGSTPTTSSTQYQLSGFREQEGATLTFTHTTTLRWFAVDPKGNRRRCSRRSTTSSGDLSDLDAGRAGDRQRQGRAGLDTHAGSTSSYRADIRPPTCSSSTAGLRNATWCPAPAGDNALPLPNQAYPVAEDAHDWFPSSDQRSDLTSQGSITVPDLCGGGQLRLGPGRSRRACSRRRRR